MKNTNKNMMYTFWSGAILLCLALVAVVLVFTNAVGNTGSPKVEATPAVTETPTPTPQANPISPIQSSAALAQTEDKGSTYVDQIYFLGDKSLKVLQSESMLTGKDAAKQVWIPDTGSLPASSLDTAGLLGHSAEDCAWVLGSMVGFDPKDSTSVNMPTEDFKRHLNDGVAGLRIGVPRKWLGEGLDPELRTSIEEAIETYRRLGAEIVDIELPMAELGVPVYYVVACAEASSNLSRFDGVRYGHRAADYTDIVDMIKKSRNEGFGAEPKRRIMIGTYVLSHGYYDAYYLKAQKVRRLIAKEFHETFKKVDVIISPVTAGTAYDFGANADPVSAYLSDLYTVPASLAGLPGISVPCGIHSNGRPLGFQLLGETFSEARLLGVAAAWQRETDWHLRRPAGY